ncbi:o-succinylbenzoate synthase [Erwinia sp. V90_4]|uniref:o-succinylbenzoate synthase n=1 Tax=Erwinia sp. V90_4 TaxID=3044239 RepID=UPI00249DDCC7|nr:o-succinylbenzoate synthase [Erwinia sp. V90_4]MDI3439431.1 o-succinylbenzoate synthase [Erwinia sp. V90_4]
MRAVALYRYQIPLEAGVVLRHQRLTARQGLLIQLRDQRGEGWGEIAPLPEFSVETPAQAEQACRAWLAAWRAGSHPAESDLPSVAFGISCALAELDGTLPTAGEYRTALLCSGDPDELFQRLRQLPQPLAKMKVGLYEAVRDGMQANLLLEALPNLTLRLDANRSWSLEKALQFARYVSPELRGRIAFIEEPCRNMAESLAFAQQTSIAVAWDESLREGPLAAAPGVSAVVIKPTLTGSIQRVQQQVAWAKSQGLTPVISSALESSLGLTQLARLAHWLTPGIIPGLDTLQLMQQQLMRRWPGSALPVAVPVTDREVLTCLWQH